MMIGRGKMSYTHLYIIKLSYEQVAVKKTLVD